MHQVRGQRFFKKIWCPVTGGGNIEFFVIHVYIKKKIVFCAVSCVPGIKVCLYDLTFLLFKLFMQNLMLIFNLLKKLKKKKFLTKRLCRIYVVFHLLVLCAKFSAL